MSKLEQRALAGELRAVERENGDGDGGGLKFTGYAAVYNSESEDLGGFTEVIAPGAFRRAIEGEDDVRALMNHDPNYVLGRLKAGTLHLSDDSHGLKFEIDAPDVQWARDLYVSVKRGDINQCSFRFAVIDDEWEDEGDFKARRTLKEVELSDVSIVTFPAYTATEAQVRSTRDVFTAHARDEPRARAEKRSTAVLTKRLAIQEREVI